MLKCASLYTCEIDDPEAAFEEINAQLEARIKLLENTVGIIMCNPEFIDAGTVKYLSEKLPFDLAGITTSSQAVNDGIGEMILTVFVMTSDDVFFISGVTGSVEESVEAPVISAFGKIGAVIEESPKLAVVFPPLILNHAGDKYVSALGQVMPGVPVFGTIATDDSLDFEESKTIYNGESYKDAMPFVLCYGNISPRFLIGTLPEDKVLPYKGEITKSNGPFVQEINNINAYKYFEGIGFASGGALAGNYSLVPFVINQKSREDYDGMPVMRTHASFTEDGTAIFRGDVDEGSTFTMLTCDANDILQTTLEKIKQLNEMPDVNGALLFPCIIRRMITQRLGPVVELETVRGGIDKDIPFMLGYSGGEICPTSLKDGIPANRFHNYSLVILIV